MRRLRQQPGIATGVDWSNPLSRGLAVLTNAAANPGGLVNYVDGARATVANAPYQIVGYGAHNYTRSNGLAGDQFTTKYNTNGALTLSVLAYDTRGANVGIIAGMGLGSSNVPGNIQPKPSTANIRALYYPTSSAVVATGSARSVWLKKWVLLTSVVDGTNLRLYENAKNTGTTACALSSTASTQAFHVGNDTSDSQTQDYLVAFCALWHRALAASEIARIADNPWQLFSAATPSRTYSLPSSSPTPTVTSVNGGATISEGATAVPVVGTNFASGMTSAIAQPGGVSVAQTTTYNSTTSASFNLTMEPGTGNQLAFTDATYTTNYTVTDTGGTSANFAITLAPPAGNIFQTLSSVNTTSSYRITATPDLVANDQLEASGNATDTSAAPTGLQLNSDGTWQISSGHSPADFYVRAYDSVNKVWGAWALQSTAVTTSGAYRFTVYELSSVAGLVRWVHYIPVQFPGGVSTYEYDRFDNAGAITCKVLSSNAGKTAWVDYIPVYVTTDPAAGKWRYDSTGWIPLVQVASG